MYVKIQKDNSENYILLEADNIELSYVKIPTSFKNYCQNLLIYMIDADSSDTSKYAAEVLETIFKDVPTGGVVATCMSVYDCKSKWEKEDAADFSCSIKGVRVDGVPYITCGNIYIMNNKGQTIQRI